MQDGATAVVGSEAGSAVAVARLSFGGAIAAAGSEANSLGGNGAPVDASPAADDASLDDDASDAPDEDTCDTPADDASDASDAPDYVASSP